MHRLPPTDALPRGGAHDPLVWGRRSHPRSDAASAVLASGGLTWRALTACSVRDRDTFASACSGQSLRIGGARRNHPATFKNAVGLGSSPEHPEGNHQQTLILSLRKRSSGKARVSETATPWSRGVWAPAVRQRVQREV